MKEPSEGTNTEPLQLVPTEAAKALPEAEVWSFYRTVLKKWRKHTRTVDLGDKDRREIKARFKSGYTVDDLQLATLGLFADVWHRENEHLGLTYALRESNIEGFITVGRRERSIAPASPAVAASPLRDDDPSQLPARAVAPGSREEANVRSVDPPSLRAPVDYSTFNRAAGTLQ